MHTCILASIHLFVVYPCVTLWKTVIACQFGIVVKAPFSFCPSLIEKVCEWKTCKFPSLIPFLSLFLFQTGQSFVPLHRLFLTCVSVTMHVCHCCFCQSIAVLLITLSRVCPLERETRQNDYSIPFSFPSQEACLSCCLFDTFSSSLYRDLALTNPLFYEKKWWQKPLPRERHSLCCPSPSWNQ